MLVAVDRNNTQRYIEINRKAKYFKNIANSNTKIDL